jgi:hypothetical protein
MEMVLLEEITVTAVEITVRIGGSNRSCFLCRKCFRRIMELDHLQEVVQQEVQVQEDLEEEVVELKMLVAQGKQLLPVEQVKFSIDF